MPVRSANKRLASGIGSEVMKPIAAPLVGGRITSTIHVLILVPVFFALMKEHALRRGRLRLQTSAARINTSVARHFLRLVTRYRHQTSGATKKEARLVSAQADQSGVQHGSNGA